MDTNAQATPEGTNEIQGLDTVQRKTKFSGTVIKTTLAGAVIDVGLEVPGVVHISQLQAEPVNRVEDVLQPGQQVEVWVRHVVPKKKRLELTMIKPLDLEWREIAKDMVIKGKVTRLEKFGVFVDIGAERPGLVHISEMTHDYIKKPDEVVKEGDEIEVKVLNVNRQKKQIKLSMKALELPVVKQVEKLAPANVGGEAKDEPVPTAMEMAMREAMERSREQQDESVKGKEKKPRSANELEKILSRTLDQKVRTK
ncbi:MAG: S1 RNA-binding domain-containing protein [Anaerolineales bacterium]|nr:S1 RNA-binding domain-containing protein [Anaerolineales bacterium]